MNASEARRMAEQAVANVTVDSPEPVADTTVVFLNDDGTYSVADNGECVDDLNAKQAVNIIIENLTSSE